jgi:hypothetical protein
VEGSAKEFRERLRGESAKNREFLKQALGCVKKSK